MLTALHVTLLNTLTQPAKPMCQGTCFIVSIHDQYFMINGSICSPKSPAVPSSHMGFHVMMSKMSSLRRKSLASSKENPHSPDTQDHLGF